MCIRDRNITSERYPALVIFNALFGGGPYSKLFNNVRERLSLAYYVSSRAEAFKGYLSVNSGIEVADFQKAFDEIMLQLKHIQNNDITEDELSAAVLTTVNSIKSIADSAAMMEDYWLGRLLMGSQIDFDQFVEQVKNVAAKDVVDIAKDIVPDTVYFLKGKETQSA